MVVDLKEKRNCCKVVNCNLNNVTSNIQVLSKLIRN